MCWVGSDVSIKLTVFPEDIDSELYSQGICGQWIGPDDV